MGQRFQDGAEAGILRILLQPGDNRLAILKLLFEMRAVFQKIHDDMQVTVTGCTVKREMTGFAQGIYVSAVFYQQADDLKVTDGAGVVESSFAASIALMDQFRSSTEKGCHPAGIFKVNCVNKLPGGLTAGFRVGIQRAVLDQQGDDGQIIGDFGGIMQRIAVVSR